MRREGPEKTEQRPGYIVTSRATPGATQGWRRRGGILLSKALLTTRQTMGKDISLVVSHSVRCFISPAPRNSYSWLGEFLPLVTKDIA